MQTNGTAEAAIFYDVAAISAQSQYNLVEVTSYVLMAKDHRLAQLETTVDLADLAEEPFIQMA